MNIHDAVERGKIDVVQELLHGDRLLVNSKNIFNDQPLHIAAWHKKKKIAVLLLGLGADVNAHGDQGKTPLHYAVLSGSRPIIELLIRKGADTQLVNGAGVTPIYLAASTENHNMVDTLVSLGQSIDLASSIYVDGPQEVLSRLEESPELLSSIPQSENLIWDAIRVQSVELVRFLLRHGVDPNRKIHGSYPLLDAIAHKSEALVRLLLENGADISIKDHVGRGVLKYCEMHGALPAITDLLKSHGAASY